MDNRWQARPHTLAKITILTKYLDAWFSIMGQSSKFSGKCIFYLDGFAGLGQYQGGALGSPLAAIRSARQARTACSERWIASDIHCIFVEENKKSSLQLSQHLIAAGSSERVHSHLITGEFSEQFETIGLEHPDMLGDSPLFAFLDPFGPKGLNFDVVKRILSSPSSEVLLHFDSDGAARMVSALRGGYNASSAMTLDRVFGRSSWRQLLDQEVKLGFPETVRRLIGLYIEAIRDVSKFAYPFQMSTPSGKEYSDVGYHLIFASQHYLGIAKMKEAMKSVGDDGGYRFSNFRSGRPILFVVQQDAENDARLMRDTFGGRTGVRWPELRAFALNETRFVTPKSMLSILEKSGCLIVTSDATRRKFTYPDDRVNGMSFDFALETTRNGQEVSD